MYPTLSTDGNGINNSSCASHVFDEQISN